MGNAQVEMLAGRHIRCWRDAVFIHPTMTEGLGPLLARVPKQRDAATGKREYARVSP
jgi:hypothetical protein